MPAATTVGFWMWRAVACQPHPGGDHDFLGPLVDINMVEFLLRVEPKVHPHDRSILTDLQGSGWMRADLGEVRHGWDDYRPVGRFTTAVTSGF